MTERFSTKSNYASFLIRHQICSGPQEKRFLINKISFPECYRQSVRSVCHYWKKRLDESDYNVPTKDKLLEICCKISYSTSTVAVKHKHPFEVVFYRLGNVKCHLLFKVVAENIPLLKRIWEHKSCCFEMESWATICSSHTPSQLPLSWADSYLSHKLKLSGWEGTGILRAEHRNAATD